MRKEFIMKNTEYDFEQNGIRYKVDKNNNNEVIVTGSVHNSSSLRVPSSANNYGRFYTVTSIGPNAFCNKHILDFISLPNTLRSIGDYAFKGNPLSSLNFAKPLRHIGVGAFENCVLTHISIPESVTYIGEKAFKGNNLTFVKCDIREPLTINANTFDMVADIYINATLFVPYASLNKYKSKYPWSRFVEITSPGGSQSGVNTITIGDGTISDECVPICNWYMNSFIGSECLYLKNQLADLKAGDVITSIAFYLMDGSAQGGNFNVRMKNTSISSLKNNASAYDTSCIEVNCNDPVNGNVTIRPYSGGQWIEFPLSTPFVYNGENIIIDIRNTTPGTREGWCYFATTTYNGVRRSLNWIFANSEDPHDDGFSSGGIFSYENSSNLPNIIITYTASDIYATGISLNKTSTILTVGSTETLVATVTPSNATNKTVSWKSSDTSVATVDQNGKVTAKAVGNANITATTTDETNLTATCQVTVKQGGGNTITIGDGTVRDEVVPICNWYMNTFTGSECLYLKNQLADLKAGDVITSIAFYLMDGSAQGGNFNVRMKNTSISSLKNNASAYDTSCIEVNCNDPVNGNVTIRPYSGGQWIEFPLSTPFVYNGENIIIDIRNTTPGTREGWCYFATTTYNGVRRSLNWIFANSEDPHDDGFSSGGIFSYENSSNLPNIKINYIDGEVYAINTVEIDHNVDCVKYYNLNGFESDTPFPGINIKVTTYSDGTKSAKKILYKQ